MPSPADVTTEATHVIVSSYGGYTTDLPLTELRGRKAWIAYRHEGQDLGALHGRPARLLVPHLYFWKAAKWLNGLELLLQDEPGFWERAGHHNHGDPWREQRYDFDRTGRGGPVYSMVTRVVSNATYPVKSCPTVSIADRLGCG